MQKDRRRRYKIEDFEEILIKSRGVYLTFYTREEKMCPQGAVFLQYSLESVVSSERLLEKRSFSTVSKNLP